MELTIFTPVYNRANLIQRLYESLERQSNKDFVWLIVDDGSTDNLKQVISKYQDSASFKIEYIYQNNHGKHVAHNTGVENCKTQLFFCVDSDDYLTDDAVEKIYKVNAKYNQKNILGYFFRKKDTHNNISGGDFLLKSNMVGLREIYFKYNFSGELAIVLKTSLIKPYFFPVYENEKFVSEKVLYNQLSNIAPMAFINDIIYIYEYQLTGYTLNSKKLIVDNPIGVAMGYLSDAIYGIYVFQKAKAYSAHIAMKKVFDISNNNYPSESPSFAVKMLGKILEPHYCRLFQKTKKEYILERI